MIGNVWEWTTSKYPGSELRAVRGGSWSNTPRFARASNRLRIAPDDRYASIGFRCAK